jgi:hypothetical protein
MTTGHQSFPVAGRGKKDEQKAGEAKPVYPVWLVHLVSLVDRKQRNWENHIDQKDQVNLIHARHREICDEPLILSPPMLTPHNHMPVGAKIGGGPGSHGLG